MGAGLMDQDALRAALARRPQPIHSLNAADLVRLTRYPDTEPFWGRNKVNRFDDPEQVFGVTYVGLGLEVAFAETVLHEQALFECVAGWSSWVVPHSLLRVRHVLTYLPKMLRLLDLTGAGLKQLGLNNDISGSNDYTDSMAVSRAVYSCTDVDGIHYISRQMNTGAAVALFERSGVQAHPRSIRLVDDPAYADLLDTFQVAILPDTAA
jgi:hypothetical protein